VAVSVLASPLLLVLLDLDFSDLLPKRFILSPHILSNIMFNNINITFKTALVDLDMPLSCSNIILAVSMVSSTSIPLIFILLL
jgi:hypothetical protein